MDVKNKIKEFLPPILIDIMDKLGFRKYGWFGDYNSWSEAKILATGYDSLKILEKTKNALLKIKNKEAAYERDSVLFNKIEYSYPLLAGLMWIAAIGQGKLNVLDFGGSLGTTYFQNRIFLENLKEVTWNIAEQRHVAECGRKYFENDILRFYDDIDACLTERSPNTIIFSSSLQYIEEPYKLLEHVINKAFQFIIFDRTPFLINTERDDRITLQKVSPSIYRASYPCWFFNEGHFLEFFKNKYNFIADFNSFDRANIPSIFKGFIFSRK